MWGSQVRMQPGSRAQAAGAGGTHHWAAKWFGAPGSPAPSTAAQSPGPQRQCSPSGHWRMRGPPPSRPALWRQRTDRPPQITADPCCWLTGGWHLTALGAQGLLLWWPGFAWPIITQGSRQRHWGRDLEPEAESLAGAFSLSQDTPGLGVLRTRLASSPPGHKSLPTPHLVLTFIILAHPQSSSFPLSWPYSTFWCLLSSLTCPIRRCTHFFSLF